MVQLIQHHRTTTNVSVVPGPVQPAGVISLGIPAAQTRMWVSDGTTSRLLISTDPADTPLVATNVITNAAFSGAGTSGSPLALVPATGAQIGTGTDAIHALNSAGLRTQLGDNVINLVTTAKTVVPAINEIDQIMRTLASVMYLIGTLDVPNDQVTVVAGSPMPANGPLPQAVPANTGWYVIVDQPGTGGTGHIPPGAIATADWLISNGTTWLHFAMHIATVVAANVAITPIPGLGAVVNVQDALALLQTSKLDQTAGDARYLQLIGGTVTGPIVLPAAAPTLGTHATNKAYVDLEVGKMVPLAGGVMNGFLQLSANPTAPLHAATKAYVDAAAAGGFTGVILESGGGLVGDGLATAPLGVAYVDGGLF